MSLIQMRWILCVVVLSFVPVLAQEADDIEWTTYGGDLASTRYSPADQINADNFNDLEVAWRLKTRNFGPTPEYNFQSTPLMVGGVLYTTAGSRRAVVAANAGTGELLWMHRLDEGERGAAAPRRLSGRGLAYRDDGGSGQILYVTPGYQLIALDAATGQRIPSFGTDGIVDLKQDMDQDIDLVTGEVGLHAAPIVAGDTFLIGAAHLPGSAPRSMENVKGYVRGFDTRTGERRWIFHTIPGADEFGNDTWLNESWRYTGNTGAWGQMSVDEKLGVAYFATEMPTNDYYGGHRHGDNLFSDSLVAVDLETGERLWYYQFIHHDVWDWDLPCAPILADITVDGRAIKAVAQPSKQGWLYVFDRETGEPVWPIEERPVEASNVPGELLATAQPFPTKPPAYDRQGVGPEDLIDFTPELRTEAGRIISNYRIGPIFTPPTVSVPEGPWGTLMLLSQTGGTNWPGGSLDPETGIALPVLVYAGRVAGSDHQRPRAVRHGLHSRARTRSQRRRRRAEHRRHPDHQAAVGADHGHRPERRRDPLASCPRGDAGQYPEPPAATGCHRASNRQGRAHRHARDRDARHCRRGRDVHDPVGCTGRHAPRL